MSLQTKTVRKLSATGMILVVSLLSRSPSTWSDSPAREGKSPKDGEQRIRTGRGDAEKPPQAAPREGELSVAKTVEGGQSPARISRSTGQRAFPVVSEKPSPDDAKRALRLATDFFHSKVAIHGGYVWEYSGDLTLQEGEGRTQPTTIWVQPPGTPAVGEAFLDAYEATGEKPHLDAALDAARALLKGQHRSGGWDYFVEFDPSQKQPMRTNLDDDTTQAALRFLMRLDKILQFKDKEIHEAVAFALKSILKAQYPNGTWFVLWRKPPEPPNPADYPVIKASYPETWPRTPAGYPERPVICYIINDNLVSNMIETMLRAWDVYGDEQYLVAAKRAGDFLLLAQMPEPQPAWIQQYDRNMQPIWGRKFEPPAITGLESQTVMEGLLTLYRRTGEKKYLAPIPSAIAYLRRSLLPDGRVARFYELKTNRPIYFTKQYELTYTSESMPTHYGFIFDSRLDAIEAEYRRLLAAEPSALKAAVAPESQRPTAELAAKVRNILAAMDERGAWVERRPLRFHQIEPPSGVIRCSTFAANVRVLCEFLAAGK